MADFEKFSSAAELDAHIDSYLEGRLNEAERDAFEMKCLDDKIFFRRVKERELFREKVAMLLRQEGAQIFDEGLPKTDANASQRRSVSLADNLRRWWAGIPAAWKVAAAPALAVLLMLFLLRPDPFAPNATLEAMLTSRSSTDLRLTSPRPGERITGRAMFHWRFSEHDSVEFVLLDNKGKKLYALRTARSSYAHPKELPPGLYYWQIIQHDKLGVSKFIVEQN